MQVSPDVEYFRLTSHLLWLLLEREAHFVGLAESQIFVEWASEIAGMEGDAAQALVAAPRDRGDH